MTNLSLLYQTSNLFSLKATLEELMAKIHASKLKVQDLSTHCLKIEGRIQCHQELIAQLKTQHESLQTRLSQIPQGSPEELRQLAKENARTT